MRGRGGGLIAATLGLLVAVAIVPTASAQFAQQLPGPAEPGLLDRRFEMPGRPKSQEEPVLKPDRGPVGAPANAREIKFILSAIVVEGATAYPVTAFVPLYQEFMGREISLADIYTVAERITAKYGADGYILSQALVPAQRIVSGLVKIRVVEGYVDKVIVAPGNNGPANGSGVRYRLIERMAESISRSRPLKSEVLERQLLLIDDLPGVTARAVLQPSDAEGAADLLLIVDRERQEGLFSFDNRGSRFIGPFQATLSASANSYLGREERLTLSAITVTGTVNGGQALSANAGAGAVNFQSNIGATTALASLSVTGATIAVDSVTTTGAQSYTGALTLDGTLTTANAPVTVAGNLTLASAGAIATSGGNVTVTGTINGGQTLSANAGAGAIDFQNNIGGTTALTSLTATAATIAVDNVTTTGAQNYTGIVTLDGGLTTAGGAIAIAGALRLASDATLASGGGAVALTGTVDAVSATPRALTIVGGTGDVTLSGTVGALNALTTLTIGGNDISLASIGTAVQAGTTGAVALTAVDNGGDTGSIVLNGLINSGGPQSYGGATQAIAIAGNLTANNANITVSGPATVNGAVAIDAGAGTVAFGSTLAAGANNLTVTAREIDFAGAVSGSGTLTLQADSPAIATFVGGSTSGAGQLDLTSAEIALLQNGFASLVFGRVGSSAGLTINAATLNDPATFRAGAGGITVAGNLVANDGATFAAATTLAANVTSSGAAVTFNGNVSVGTATTPTVTTAGGALAVNGSIDGAGALTLNAGSGALTVANAIGATAALSSLAATGATIAVDDVTTTGAQSYAGALTLDGTLTTANAPVTVTGNVSLAGASGFATAGGNVTVTGTINGGQALSANAGAGAINFQGDIGGSTALASLAATGATIALNDVTTTGGQLYTGAVTLNSTLSSQNAPVSVVGPLTIASPATIAAGTATIALGGTVTAGANSVTLTADDVVLGGNWSGTGEWRIQPATASRTIGLAGAAGGLELSTLELARLAAGDASYVRIGRTDGTGAITGNAFAFNDPIGFFGGPIALNGFSGSASGLTLVSTGAVTGSIVTSAGTGAIAITAPSIVLSGSTINGIGGASAVAQVTVVGAVGAGPYSVNGVDIFAAAPPPPPPPPPVVPPPAPPPPSVPTPPPPSVPPPPPATGTQPSAPDIARQIAVAGGGVNVAAGVGLLGAAEGQAVRSFNLLAGAGDISRAGSASPAALGAISPAAGDSGPSTPAERGNQFLEGFGSSPTQRQQTIDGDTRDEQRGRD
jgi:hypothetical protein